MPDRRTARRRGFHGCAEAAGRASGARRERAGGAVADAGGVVRGFRLLGRQLHQRAADPPAAVDLQVLVLDFAVDVAGGVDVQALAHREVALEPPGDLSRVNRRGALEQTGLLDVQQLGAVQFRFHRAFHDQRVAGADFPRQRNLPADQQPLVIAGLADAGLAGRGLTGAGGRRGRRGGLRTPAGLRAHRRVRLTVQDSRGVGARGRLLGRARLGMGRRRAASARALPGGGVARRVGPVRAPGCIPSGGSRAGARAGARACTRSGCGIDLGLLPARLGLPVGLILTLVEHRGPSKLLAARPVRRCPAGRCQAVAAPRRRSGCLLGDPGAGRAETCRRVLPTAAASRGPRQPGPTVGAGGVRRRRCASRAARRCGAGARRRAP